MAEVQQQRVIEWQPAGSAPKDGSEFLGAWYWPSPDTHKRFEKTVLREPAPGVTYRELYVTYWFDNAWHVQGHPTPVDQDGLYAWAPFTLPAPPDGGAHG